MKMLIVGKVKLIARMTVHVYKLDCATVVIQAVPVCCRPNTREFHTKCKQTNTLHCR